MLNFFYVALKIPFLLQIYNVSLLLMKRTGKISHPAADAMDWSEAVSLIHKLTNDGRYRDSMIITTGCMLGLRVSDFLRLRWQDILDSDVITLTEQKTGKTRKLKVNNALRSQTQYCYNMMGVKDKGGYIFNSGHFGGKRPISRIRVHQILKDIQADYDITTAHVFSCHTLRKTFGRRVWLNECRQGRGDQALELLKELFGHENVLITKRYLGIRQEELLALYDKLTEN